MTISNNLILFLKLYICIVVMFFMAIITYDEYIINKHNEAMNKKLKKCIKELKNIVHKN